MAGGFMSGMAVGIGCGMVLGIGSGMAMGTATGQAAAKKRLTEQLAKAVDAHAISIRSAEGRELSAEGLLQLLDTMHGGA
ncbi:MAG: hypothetical protein JXR94_23490 [Candidatus Hydrogenedentes bacterium]|nr:hypothetical protein [Candidatus Hydrogenedentota bacterium]